MNDGAAPTSSTANTITTGGAPAIPPPQLNTPTGERLSIHQGMERLRALRTPAAQPKAPAQSAAPAEPVEQTRGVSRDPEPLEDEENTQPAAAAEQPVDAPAEDDETAIEIEEEQQPAQDAALQAPSSYSAEERAAFSKLPRPAQEAALRLETSRRAAFSREQQAAAKARETAEASVQQVAAERQFLMNQVAPLLQSLQQDHHNEFADIRTPGDLRRMADVDPARYARWQAQQVSIQMAQQAQHQLQQQEQAQQEQRDREEGLTELRKLATKVKGWDTPEGLKKGMTELQNYVLSYDGVARSDLALFRKAPFIEMARKAHLYDQALARKKTAPAPQPQTASPSPGRVASGTALAATNRAVQNLRVSGSIDDALAALKARRGIRQR